MTHHDPGDEDRSYDIYCSNCGDPFDANAENAALRLPHGSWRPSRPSSGRLIEIREDGKTGNYTLAHCHNGTSQYGELAKTERAALRLAADHGYTDVVYASESRPAGNDAP